MLVPLAYDQKPSRAGTDERMETPGALTSGFIRSEMGVGPREEKPASRPVFDTAATAIPFAAVPGEPIEPRPSSL